MFRAIILHIVRSTRLCKSLWYITPTMLPAGHRPATSWVIARNMLSWLELLINRYCCVWFVVYIIYIVSKINLTLFISGKCRSFTMSSWESEHVTSQWRKSLFCVYSNSISCDVFKWPHMQQYYEIHSHTHWSCFFARPWFKRCSIDSEVSRRHAGICVALASLWKMLTVTTTSQISKVGAFPVFVVAVNSLCNFISLSFTTVHFAQTQTSPFENEIY
jgi:hypothetical protein